MSTRIHAFGTQLSWDPAGGSAFVLIAGVTSIKGPGLKRDTVDVTAHDSTSMWRQFIKSLKDGGELSFDLMFDPADGSHNATIGLLSDFAVDAVIANFQLRFPDTASTTWTMPAIVTGFETAEPIDDVLKGSITLKVSSQPTLA